MFLFPAFTQTSPYSHQTKYSLFCENRKSFHFKCTLVRDVAAIESDTAAARETLNTNTASKHATG